MGVTPSLNKRLYALSLVLSCLCTLFTTTANAQSPVPLADIEVKLHKLPEDLYARLELLESLQKALSTAPNTAPKGYLQALKGLNLYLLANAQSERGANAIDYWAFSNEVVEPLQNQAKAAFDKALSDPGLLPVTKAWSHYYRGLLNHEFAEEKALMDFKAACALGYALACQQQ